MDEEREEFLNGVLAFSDAMRSVRIDPQALSIVLSEEDGRRLEHILTRNNMMVMTERTDPRYSQPAEDGTREMQVAGVKFVYRAKLWKFPSGAIR